MPTMKGSIWAENFGWREVQGPFIDTVTLFFNHRDITADAALTLLTHSTKNIWVKCGFSQIISHGHLEEFDPPLPRIMRTDVTSITFRTAASEHCKVRSRWVIFAWE